MSRFQRVQQWSAFARNWYVYDAKWQNPFHSARKITKVLEGRHKPIYHPLNDCGDHVVVINSKDVALIGREWQLRVYFHHLGPPRAYGGGAHWIPAWQLHSRDPTLVMWKACYSNMYGGMERRTKMARLHVYPGEDVPEDIISNVSGQIAQVRPVPKKLDEFSTEELEKFPKLWDYPEEYVVK
jgi:large subunit ribosomal protein L13